MHKKQDLIDAIDTILSTNNALNSDDRLALKETKEALKQAKTKEELIQALKPLTYLFQLIKSIVEIISP